MRVGLPSVGGSVVATPLATSGPKSCRVTCGGCAENRTPGMSVITPFHFLRGCGAAVGKARIAAAAAAPRPG